MTVDDGQDRRRICRPLVLDAIAHAPGTAAADQPMLAPLSCQFAPGLLHVVGGAARSGKSTLLSILSLAVQPTQGVLWWGEVDLFALAPARQASWRRDKVGLVRQNSRLIGVMSAREHIRLAAGIRGHPEAEAGGLAILDALGMADRLDCRPAQLNGGEKQRLLIAQALCASPAILLADEPTAALGHDGAALVASTLRNFARANQAVVICTSRDLVLLNAADELLVLD